MSQSDAEWALGQVLSERGFLILASKDSRKVGEIIYEPAYCGTGLITQPVRVIAFATEQEFCSQSRRLAELLETHEEGFHQPNLYRVVTD